MSRHRPVIVAFSVFAILFLTGFVPLTAQRAASVFDAIIHRVHHAVGGFNPQESFEGDFNNDGHQDILVTSDNAICVVLPQQRVGGLALTSTINPQYGPMKCAIGEFNGDGKIDLVVALGWYYYLEVYTGNGNGTFSYSKRTTNSPPVSWMSSPAISTVMATRTSAQAVLTITCQCSLIPVPGHSARPFSPTWGRTP